MAEDQPQRFQKHLLAGEDSSSSHTSPLGSSYPPRLPGRHPFPMRNATFKNTCRPVKIRVRAEPPHWAPRTPHIFPAGSFCCGNPRGVETARGACRLETCDIADWKSAPQAWRLYECGTIRLVPRRARAFAASATQAQTPDELDWRVLGEQDQGTEE
jgi:hypothetical protein